ncbi:hypothetical protein INR49_029122 [Caranx melampygus]|nr:hypothetical protein INR49_029122 [Caranx melampygus]
MGVSLRLDKVAVKMLPCGKCQWFSLDGDSSDWTALDTLHQTLSDEDQDKQHQRLKSSYSFQRYSLIFLSPVKKVTGVFKTY